MAIFTDNFFPTPVNLIRKLLKPFFIERGYNEFLNINGNVLEPSAGKGDIAKYIINETKAKVYCIEVEPELQQILRSDGLPVIHSDFLNYEKDMYFDFIIMNPPFENGDLHLLKAIEISTKTKIACILNAETIKNPYTENRKLLLQYIEQFNGKVEFVKNAFIEAERKTNVEIALIWLEVDKEDKFFDFESISEDEVQNDFDFNFSEFDLQKNDFINNIKIRAEKAKLALIDKIKAEAKFNYYSKQLTEDTYSDAKDWILKDEKPEHIYSHFSIKTKVFMWKKVISFLDIKNYMSSGMIKDFDAFIADQSNMAFNKENIFSFFNMIFNNKHKIIEDMIVNVFDYLTSYAHANVMVVPKWKTNSAYKINRKIIAPAYVKYGQYMSTYDLKQFGDRFSLGYSDWGKSNLSDLEKVMCALSGKSFQEIHTISNALELKFNEIGKVYTGDKIDNVCYSEFFKIKFWRKGTIHLEFLDKKLWEEFNYRACFNKNWLPDDEKRKQEGNVMATNLLLEMFN